MRKSALIWFVIGIPFIGLLVALCIPKQPIAQKSITFSIEKLNKVIAKAGHDTVPVILDSNQVYFIIAQKNLTPSLSLFTDINALTYVMGKHSHLTIIFFSDISYDSYSDLSDNAHVLPVYWFLPEQSQAVNYCYQLNPDSSQVKPRVLIIAHGKIVFQEVVGKSNLKVWTGKLWDILATYPDKGGNRKV